MGALYNPKLRVRTKSSWGYEYLEKAKILRQYADGSIRVTYDTPFTIQRGSFAMFQDYVPVVFKGPPRLNWMAANRVSSSSTSGEWYRKPTTSIYGLSWKGRFASSFITKTKYWDQTSISTPLTFDLNIGDYVHQKALAKLNDPDIAANEYLFEYKQVLDLLKSPLKAALKSGKILKRWLGDDQLIYSPKRGHIGETLLTFRTRRKVPIKRVSKQTLAGAMNTWLAYRYGVLPLYGDITTVFGQLVDGKLPNINQLQLHRCSARQVVESSEHRGELTSRMSLFTATYAEISKYTDAYVAKVIYQKRCEPSTQWKYGIHPRQWADVLWNATPWSFVGDWFFSVDQWLKAIEVNPYVSIRGNCVTRKVTMQTQLHQKRVLNVDYPNAPIDTVVPSVGSLRIDRVRREINLQTPRSIMSTAKWQSVKNVLTGLSLIGAPVLQRNLSNEFALMAQDALLRKRKRPSVLTYSENMKVF